MVHATICAAAETFTDVGLKTRLLSDGAARSSGDDVTVRFPLAAGSAKFPARSVRKTVGVHVPASAKRGIEKVHENVPLFRVPEDGAVALHPWAWSLFGASKTQVAVSTPDFASVTVMLHVTFCAAAETFTDVGLGAKVVSAGGVTSGSEVTTSWNGKPWDCGRICLWFVTPSRSVTEAVQMPAIE
jgi:hypothetical protein